MPNPLLPLLFPPQAAHTMCYAAGTSQRTSAAPRVRQPHQLSANQRHVHSIRIKYCEKGRATAGGGTSAAC
eukprot:1145830-Pelagomonas_calceolata.AAC.1